MSLSSSYPRLLWASRDRLFLLEESFPPVASFLLEESSQQAVSSPLAESFPLAELFPREVSFLQGV